MKKHIIYILFLLPFTSFAQGIPEQYLTTAAENNPELKARFNEYMAALEQVPQVKSLADPRIAFGYFIQPVETRVGPQNAKISIDQMFPGSDNSKPTKVLRLSRQKRNTKFLKKPNRACFLM